MATWSQCVWDDAETTNPKGRDMFKTWVFKTTVWSLCQSLLTHTEDINLKWWVIVFSWYTCPTPDPQRNCGVNTHWLKDVTQSRTCLKKTVAKRPDAQERFHGIPHASQILNPLRIEFILDVDGGKAHHSNKLFETSSTHHVHPRITEAYSNPAVRQSNHAGKKQWSWLIIWDMNQNPRKPKPSSCLGAENFPKF